MLFDFLGYDPKQAELLAPFSMAFSRLFDESFSGPNPHALDIVSGSFGLHFGRDEQSQCMEYSLTSPFRFGGSSFSLPRIALESPLHKLPQHVCIGKLIPCILLRCQVAQSTRLDHAFS